MFLGTLIMLMVGAGFVSPRTLAFAGPIVLSGFVFAWLIRPKGSRFDLTAHVGTLTLLAFLALTAASALWSEQPSAAVKPLITSAFVFCGCWIIVLAVLNESRPNILHMAEGLWIGFLFGVTYLLVEILTGQAVKIYIYNALDVPQHQLRPPRNFVWRGEHLHSIAPVDLTRNIAPVTPLLWPALLTIRATLASRLSHLLVGMAFVLAAVLVFLGEHETSKLALVGGTAAFLVSRASQLSCERMLKVGWIVACLAAVPISMSLYRLDLHNATWLQSSAKHRIVIWNHTAEQAIKSPIIGRGAGIMYQMLEPPAAQVEGESFARRAPHAHNVYLQTWYELGALGAAVLTLIGLALLDRIRSFPQEVAPYAHATFASAAMVAASSYGMWQPWFLTMFALAMVAFAVALRTVVSSHPLQADAGAP
jgi:hypothetical protein